MGGCSGVDVSLATLGFSEVEGLDTFGAYTALSFLCERFQTI